MYYMDIDKVRTLALNKGMSLSGLCEKAGMRCGRATDWKKRGVRPRSVYRIAQILDVEPSEIVKKDN